MQNNQNMEESPSYKVIILGDTGVGKTSLANRQCNGKFTFQMTPTVGTAHLKTNINIENRNVELKIWDTAGQEQFASLVSMYARGANACIIVGSFVDPGSIDNIDVWAERLHNAGEDPPILIAINKIDMQNGAPLTIEQIRDQIGSKYENLFFVSARTGDGISELFAGTAQEAITHSKSQSTSSSVDIAQPSTPEKEKKSGGCCH